MQSAFEELLLNSLLMAFVDVTFRDWNKRVVAVFVEFFLRSLAFVVVVMVVIVQVRKKTSFY